MKANTIFAIILSFSVSLFIFFNYIPSLLELSALETERQILLQLVDKEQEIEQKLVQENSKLIVKLKATDTAGNRGFLIKEGKPE